MLFSATEDFRNVDQITVRVNGRTHRATGWPTRKIDLTAFRSVYSLTLEIEPDIPRDGNAYPATCEIRMSGTSRVFFTGFAGEKDIDRTTRTLTVGDTLWKLNTTVEEMCSGGGEPIYLDNETYDQALLKILNAAGIEDYKVKLPIIEPVRSWPEGGSYPEEVTRICPIMERCIEINENLAQIFQNLCDFLGLAAFSLPSSGIIQFVHKDTRPVENPTIEYSNASSSKYAVVRARRTVKGFENAVKVSMARGTEAPKVDGVEGTIVEARWQVSDEVLARGRPITTTNEFIQTQDQAEWIAEREGRLACRWEDVVDAVLPMDTDLLPGSSIWLEYPPSNVIRSQFYVIAAHITDPSTMNVTLSSGPSLTNGYQTGQTPIADFLIMVLAETVRIAGEITTLYDIICDARGSFDPDGEITAYEWTVSGATPLNTVAQTAETLILLDTLENVSITLTVTDDNDPPNTDTITRAILTPDTEIYYRKLTAVVDGKWGILPKDTWHWFTPPGAQATAVPIYNTEGPLYMGDSLGDIWSRPQDLSEEPSVVHNVGGSITDIYVGEPLSTPTAIDSVAVAVGTKIVWTHNISALSPTWREYQFGTTVRAVGIDPFNITHLTVCVGNTLRHSYDGTNWETLITNPDPGAQAEGFASGPWDGGVTAVVFSGTSDADRVIFSNGATWSCPTMTGEPQTITPGYTVHCFKIGTSAGKLYLFTYEAGTNSYTGTEIGSITSGNIKRIVRESEYPILYGADITQLFKQISDDPTQIYEIVSGDALRVGYAGLEVPPQGVIYSWQDATLMWHTHPDLRQMTLNGDQVTGWISTGTEDYTLVGHPSGSEPVFNGSYVQGAVNKKMTCILPGQRDGRFRALYVVVEIRGDASRYVLVRDSALGGAHTGWYKPAIMVLSGERVGLNLRGGVTYGSNQGPYVINCPFNTKVLIGMRQGEDGKTYVTLNGNPMGSWTPSGDPGHSAAFCGLGSFVAQYSSSSRTYAIVGFLDSDLPILTTEQEQVIINNLTELYGPFGV
jgi:hypothetical protein